jgi:hypothetical protein
LSENLANSIQQLILIGKGDRGRLEYILDLLQRGKILPSSDQKYLERIIPLYLGTRDGESLKEHSEHAIEELYGEVQTLNEKISKLERKGFEKYIGKKAIFFFVTFFVGWNALQSYIMPWFNSFMSKDTAQYLFPLNVLANYLNATSLVWFIFGVMALAWPFIGTTHLVNYIRRRKVTR